MSSLKRHRSPAEIEDVILGKIFLVSLTDSTPKSNSVYLEMTAAEILSEGKDLKLTRDEMERVLIDRLSGNFVDFEPPFHYLINCYRRAQDEMKKIGAMRDRNVRVDIEDVIRQAKKLIVSYCRIHLSNPDMFPNWGGERKGASQLLPLVFAEVGREMETVFGGGEGGGDGVYLPGFTDEFFADADYDSMEVVMKQLYEDLRGSVLKVSALGNFQLPLGVLLKLVKYPVGAKGLVNHPWWTPKSVYLNGRVIEMTSILGPFFHVSALPDNALFKGQPDVG